MNDEIVHFPKVTSAVVFIQKYSEDEIFVADQELSSYVLDYDQLQGFLSAYLHRDTDELLNILWSCGAVIVDKSGKYCQQDRLNFDIDPEDKDDLKKLDTSLKDVFKRWESGKL